MSTLLKIFFLPRVKTLFWQMLVVNVICIVAILLKNFQVAAFCLIGFLYVISYNLMNVNFSDNLEWMRNSVYSPKMLLKYYFVEQTLMFLTTVLSLLFSIFGVGALFILYAKNAVEKAAHLENNDMITMLGPLYEHAKKYIDASPTENALEIVFFFVIIFSFMYGGQIVKTYFLTLRFEKKFSKEARFFQALMIAVMLFIITMDRFDFVFKFKIILMPLILAVDVYAIMFAANQCYKIFRPSKKSPLAYIPASLFVIVFTSAFVFSQFSFKMTKDINKKIAEHRFLGVLAPDFETGFTDKAFLAPLTESALSYMMTNYPLDMKSDLFYQVVNSKGLKHKVLLTEMWKLEDLEHEKRTYLLKVINEDFLKLENEKSKRSISSLFLGINGKIINDHPEYQNIEIATFKPDPKQTRLPASINEIESNL